MRTSKEKMIARHRHRNFSFIADLNRPVNFNLRYTTHSDTTQDQITLRSVSGRKKHITLPKMPWDDR